MPPFISAASVYESGSHRAGERDGPSLRGLDMCSTPGIGVFRRGIRSGREMAEGRLRIRFFLAALAGAAGLLLLPLAGQAQAMKCDGKKVTIMGPAGNDHIAGKKAS